MGILSRRGFFKAAAVAPVAAKTVVEEAAGMALGQPGYFGGMALKSVPMPTAPGMSYWQGELAGCKRYLARLYDDGRKADQLRSRRRQCMRLDPDIAAMRALSMQARIRMQSIRDHENETANEEKHLLERIAEITKNLATSA